jgi:hypothetical protein
MRTDEESGLSHSATGPPKHASCTKKVQAAGARGTQRGVRMRRIGQQGATHGRKTTTGKLKGRIR